MMPPNQSRWQCEKGKQTYGSFIQYLARKSQENLALSEFLLEDWTKRNTEVGFQRQKEEVRCPPKDLMKILFNPNKNVDVYVENMRKTISPQSMKKRGMIFRCVL